MLVGTNNARPRLMFWPEGSMPAEGERVVTSAEANAFPAGLPIGVVHYTANNVPEVEPFARCSTAWRSCALFDYGLTGIQPPESAGPVGGGPQALMAGGRGCRAQAFSGARGPPHKGQGREPR